MKNFIYSLLTLLMFSNFIQAQDLNCGTPQNVVNSIPNFQVLSEIQDKCNIYVNVRFHIVNYDNGTGGISSTDINSMMTLLNTTFNLHKIIFVDAGFDLINSDNLANFNDTKFNNLIATNKF